MIVSWNAHLEDKAMKMQKGLYCNSQDHIIVTFEEKGG